MSTLFDAIWVLGKLSTIPYLGITLQIACIRIHFHGKPLQMIIGYRESLLADVGPVGDLRAGRCTT